MMDTIPPELLLKIFSYLRTDNSTTSALAGRTLSLVSRRFRSIAFLVLYETISLKSIGRMRLFMEMLERSVYSTTGMPVIRNLFLYDGGYDEGPDYESGVTAIDVCTAIISLAAPTLKTLAGDLRTIGFTYGHLPSSTSFPHLRDFSLGCRNMSAHEIATAETRFPRMPNLRRLHKFDVLKTEEDILDINLFTTSSSLTHIRISNFDLLSTLPRIFSSALTHQKSAESQLHLPKKLKRLIVQGTLHGVYDCLGSPESEEQWRIVCELQSLAAGKHNGGVLSVPEWGDYEVRDCEVDWREVVDSEGDGGGRGRGEGCWRDPPRETFSLVEYNAMGCPMLCD